MALDPFLARLRRTQIAERRLGNILRSSAVANARSLEQKISDAGPSNQRVDPHILTQTRNRLVQTGTIRFTDQDGVRWYYLSATPKLIVEARLAQLAALHHETQLNQMNLRLGQTLEIAIFRALASQQTLNYFGHFPDLASHDDATLYQKIEPPHFLSQRQIPNAKKVDFLISRADGAGGYAGIEAKNVREWFYPDREEIRELLLKCCALDIVPVLIARRIHYSTFSVLSPCGLILHETFNQLYPSTAHELADRVKDKTTLGYHDVRVGNDPDGRLVRFIHTNLPSLLPAAREKFQRFTDLLSEYGNGHHPYKSFAARVKRRLRGEPEDLPQFEEPEAETEPEPDEFDE